MADKKPTNSVGKEDLLKLSENPYMARQTIGVAVVELLKENLPISRDAIIDRLDSAKRGDLFKSELDSISAQGALVFMSMLRGGD